MLLWGRLNFLAAPNGNWSKWKRIDSNIEKVFVSTSNDRLRYDC